VTSLTIVVSLQRVTESYTLLWALSLGWHQESHRRSYKLIRLLRTFINLKYMPIIEDYNKVFNNRMRNSNDAISMHSCAAMEARCWPASSCVTSTNPRGKCTSWLASFARIKRHSRTTVCLISHTIFDQFTEQPAQQSFFCSGILYLCSALRNDLLELRRQLSSLRLSTAYMWKLSP
jgi:hypothetical protein